MKDYVKSQNIRKDEFAKSAVDKIDQEREICITQFLLFSGKKWISNLDLHKLPFMNVMKGSLSAANHIKRVKTLVQREGERKMHKCARSFINLFNKRLSSKLVIFSCFTLFVYLFIFVITIRAVGRV